MATGLQLWLRHVSPHWCSCGPRLLGQPSPAAHATRRELLPHKSPYLQPESLHAR